MFGVDHDKALDDVLHQLKAAGLAANLEKCEFQKKKKIKFFGLTFSGKGVSPDSVKVAYFTGLQNRMAHPNFVLSFFATVTEPLRALIKQDNDWKWGKKVKAFNAVKAGLGVSATTAYLTVKKATEIVPDASPVVLAALRVQQKRVVVYGSRVLSDVETRFSQRQR